MKEKKTIDVRFTKFIDRICYISLATPYHHDKSNTHYFLKKFNNP